MLYQNILEMYVLICTSGKRAQGLTNYGYDWKKEEEAGGRRKEEEGGRDEAGSRR